MTPTITDLLDAARKFKADMAAKGFTSRKLDAQIARIEAEIAAVDAAYEALFGASNRPGDQAAIYAAETGIDYATALVHCNMD